MIRGDSISNAEANSEPTHTVQSTSLRRTLRFYLFILWVFSAGEFAFAQFCKRVLHLGYPYNTVLLFPEARFSDWFNFLPRAAHFGEAGLLTRSDIAMPFPYPLPSLIPYVVILHLSSHPVRAYFIAAVLSFVAVAAIFSFYLQRTFKPAFIVQLTIWSTILIGYPGAFLVDRGNIEVFLWVFVVLGVVSFVKRWPYVAATCFALAGSMKIYPALLLLLFIPRRQYRAFIAGAVLLCACTVGMLAFVGPTVAQAIHDLKPSADNLRNFQILVLARGGLRFDHSLFALWKQLVAVFNSGVLHRSADEVNDLHFYLSEKIYSIVAPLALLAVYITRIRLLPLLNQFISLMLCMLLLPFVSYDYTLVHLYTVLGVLLVVSLQRPATGRQMKAISILFILLALIFTPVAELARHLYGGQVKCLLMLASLWIVLAVPLPTRLFRDEQWTQRQRHAAAEA